MIWPFRRRPPCDHREFIDHLLAENRWLKMQMVHERQRAEVSIDQRLSEKGLGIVTLPPRAETPADPHAEVEAMLRDPEFTRVGEVPE